MAKVDPRCHSRSYSLGLASTLPLPDLTSTRAAWMKSSWRIGGEPWPQLVRVAADNRSWMAVHQDSNRRLAGEPLLGKGFLHRVFLATAH
jgi:hypothetical protein